MKKQLAEDVFLAFGKSIARPGCVNRCNEILADPKRAAGAESRIVFNWFSETRREKQ